MSLEKKEINHKKKSKFKKACVNSHLVEIFKETTNYPKINKEIKQLKKKVSKLEKQIAELEEKIEKIRNGSDGSVNVFAYGG